MFEQFDELARQTEDEKNNLKNAPAQWELLKHLVSQLSEGNRSFDGHPFQWGGGPNGPAFIQLYEVAAQFFAERKRDGTGLGYRVRFGRPPLGPQQVHLDELIEPEDWELKPGSLDGEFIWLIDLKRFTPETLADSIAIKLTECYKEFKEAQRL